MVTIDFETYSEAGMIYDPLRSKWRTLQKSKSGIEIVGAAKYSEHPSTEVLSLAYDCGGQDTVWKAGDPQPADLFEYIRAGGLLEACNSLFEYYIWENVCHKRMGWPRVPLAQFRCVAARGRAISLPGALGKMAAILQVADQKIDDGKRLIAKFSIPRSPTKTDKRLRIRPEEDLTDAQALYVYNLGDIKAERAVSDQIPELSPEELDLWLLDQRINTRGVAIDTETLDACISIVSKVVIRDTAELRELTGGAVQSAAEIKKLLNWLYSRGVRADNLDEDSVSGLLASVPPLPPDVRRVLEIRASIGSASVKKLYAISNRLCADGRIRDLFQFCGALHTGRFAGRGPQPQNLPSDSVEDIELAVALLRTRDLDTIERVYGDAIDVVLKCLRSLFVAGPGMDFICSDYSAIEAVVLAEISGEAWRQEVFRTHGKIYEMSASKITGVPFEEFIRHKKETGEHHPLRKTIGKVAELASGYQGHIGAWNCFGADKFFKNDEEIKAAVSAWRAASPAIVHLWYAVEDCAKNAISIPGARFEYRGIGFQVIRGHLEITLLSGRKLYYGNAYLEPSTTQYGKPCVRIKYKGWNSDIQRGPVGWYDLETYGGKLVENIVQGTARDILAHALVELDKVGYTPVLHVHDEITAEVFKGWGSVEEFERIMSVMPSWASGWPVKASGGWRGERFKK